MVEEYLSDREQEEALLSWWRENWLWVISGVALGVAGLVGWQFWNRNTERQAENAAQVYEDLRIALTTPGTKDKAESLIKDLDANYADSPYAAQGHLLAAQTKVTAGQFEQAGNDLKVVIEKSKDDALVQIARIRLARVELQLGHPDQALALLDVNKAGAFAVQVHDVRGDALLAKGDRAGARLSYQTALTESAGKDPTGTELLRLKLQDLSDAQSVAPADALAPAPAPMTPKAE
jgi:predicted negative regulator of RcsB-dependent stress response